MAGVGKSGPDFVGLCGVHLVVSFRKSIKGERPNLRIKKFTECLTKYRETEGRIGPM